MTAGSNTGDGVTLRWESASAAFTLDGPQWGPLERSARRDPGDRTPVRISWRATAAALLEELERFGIRAAPGWDAGGLHQVRRHPRVQLRDPGAVQGKVQCVDGTSVLGSSDRVASPVQGGGGDGRGPRGPSRQCGPVGGRI